MLIDSRLEFSVAQALVATAVSESVIDLGQDRDVGVGKTLFLVILLKVATDFTTGNETYSVDLQTDSASSFASPTSLGTIAIVGAQAAGTQYVLAIPPTGLPEQFLRLNYTLGGVTPSVTLDAFITDQLPTRNVSYPDAI